MASQKPTTASGAAPRAKGLPTPPPALLKGRYRLVGKASIFAMLTFPTLGLAWQAPGLEEALVCVLALVSMLILLVPLFVQRHYDLFEPVSFTILTAGIGVYLRSLFLVHGASAGERHALLLNHPVSFLLEAWPMLLLGLACLVIGYAVRVPPVNLRRLPILHRQRWSMKRFTVVAIVLGGIAIVSTALYIEKMGIVFTTLDTISSKRKYELANASFGHASLGYYVWGASLFTPLLYLYTAWFAEAGKRLVSMAGLVLVVLALGAALVPFIKSSRTGVLIVFVHVAVIWHYLRGPIRLRSLALAGAALLAIFLVLTALRARAQDTDELAAYVGVEAVMSELVGSRNLFGIAKSSLIAHHVPETIDYKYGSTFVVWIYTPVPRTLWKNKPVIHVGNEIGDKIYSNPEGSGVPPGFFGEAYLNFGWIGVPFAFFVLGVLMRLIYASFWPYRSNKNAVVVYATVATAVAYSAVGGDVAGAVIGIATSLIPLLVAIAFVGRRAQPLAPA